MVNIDNLLAEYIPFGKDIPYKDWKITPVKVKNSVAWTNCYNILDIDKNSLNSIEIIKMSYLKFLGYISQEEDLVMKKLTKIFQICLNIKEEEIFLVSNGQEDFEIIIGSPIERKDGKKIPDYINGRKISSQEFDEIRKIILYQNIYDFDDSYIDPDVKKAVEDYYNYVNRGVSSPSLEKQIACVQSKTGMPIESIYNMTYRAFLLLFQTVIDQVDYEIMKTAEVSGNVEFKKPVDHWAFKPDKGKFGDAFVGMDNFQQKMGNTSMAKQEMSEEDYIKEEYQKRKGEQ